MTSHLRRGAQWLPVVNRLVGPPIASQTFPPAAAAASAVARPQIQAATSTPTSPRSPSPQPSQAYTAQVNQESVELYSQGRAVDLSQVPHGAVQVTAQKINALVTHPEFRNLLRSTLVPHNGQTMSLEDKIFAASDTADVHVAITRNKIIINRIEVQIGSFSGLLNDAMNEINRNVRPTERPVAVPRAIVPQASDAGGPVTDSHTQPRSLPVSGSEVVFAPAFYSHGQPNRDALQLQVVEAIPFVETGGRSYNDEINRIGARVLFYPNSGSPERDRDEEERQRRPVSPRSSVSPTPSLKEDDDEAVVGNQSFASCYSEQQEEDSSAGDDSIIQPSDSRSVTTRAASAPPGSGFFLSKKRGEPGDL